MGFGVVSLLDAVFRRSFTSAGLRPGSATVDDADTTVHFWAHRSLLAPTTAAEPEPEHAQRPVVVLIHGFGPGPTWQWAAQVGPLSRRFDLVVPTLLFFGASRTSAPARAVSEPSQAAAIAALLATAADGRRHLPGLGPGRQVHVVGASYGGIVAYHLARALLRDGGGVEVGKVVICGSDMTKGPEDDRALAARGGMGVEEVAELMVPADTRTMRRVTTISFHRPPKYMPECIARDLLRKSLVGGREEKMELIKAMTTAGGSQITPLTQEMLIIWGEFDQIFPLEKAYQVKEKLGEKATLKVIPNSGHLPSQEEPKLFNRVLLDFLLQPPGSNGSATAAAAK
ncbi:hypothetical protein BS78_03G051500 [Paspalum vaginatum]|nr:hypothetical protein BS78_03G051500 [Paspalum vaginatum]